MAQRVDGGNSLSTEPGATRLFVLAFTVRQTMSTTQRGSFPVRTRALALIAVALGACSSGADLPTRPRAVTARPFNVHSLGAPIHTPMLDELLSEVNNRAPGFGGMYWSAKNVLTIHITPRGSRNAIERAVREVFDGLNWSDVKSVNFRPAQFEVKELDVFRGKVRQAAGSAVVWTDFDEMNNAIKVGVDEGADLGAFAARIRDFGARDGMVRFEHTKRPRQMQYLMDVHRPTVGGVKIELWNAARSGDPLGWCTLGFNARLSTDGSHEYFVTNGHCTVTQNSVDGAVAFQPTRYLGSPSDSAIGIEVADPSLRSGISGCPTGYLCRYSDAALFQYTNNSFSDFAYLAKDSSFSSTVGVSGSRYRVNRFHVVNEIAEYYFLAADTVNHDTWVHKVGQTTGWTWGPIISTCMDFYSAGGVLKCQYRVQAEADGGDSGSPVFWWQCCGVNEAWLGGVLHSGLSGYDYYFSSITGIKNDIANLVTY